MKIKYIYMANNEYKLINFIPKINNKNKSCFMALFFTCLLLYRTHFKDNIKSLKSLHTQI